ncbi:MAG: PadR family transcriptional regulator [Acetatifactor sp.]|nr:PadR family transcriptional regulator [Acetatifactor sp.]
MEEHIKKVYVPMTETGFYILYCLQDPMHGYNIVQQVLKLTDGEIRISPGTMYGSLSKMERDGVICFVREEEKRKIYRITELGREVLALEMRRIRRLYRTVEGSSLEEAVELGDVEFGCCRMGILSMRERRGNDG